MVYVMKISRMPLTLSMFSFHQNQTISGLTDCTEITGFAYFRYPTHLFCVGKKNVNKSMLAVFRRPESSEVEFY